MLYNLSYQKVPILSNNDHIALIQKYIEIEHKHYRYNPEKDNFIKALLIIYIHSHTVFFMEERISSIRINNKQN